ncbi:hypothetical protein FQR65_LT16591 [Abscondita terminalis]|nr:hypothetical protein FQR65_LT16591 [Abscondita terminalis]
MISAIRLRKVVKAKTSDTLTSDSGMVNKRKPVKKKLCYSSDSCSSADDLEDEPYPKPPRKFFKKIAYTKTSENLSNQGSRSVEEEDNEVVVAAEAVQSNRNECTIVIPNITSTNLKGTTNLNTNNQTEFQKQVLRLLHTLNYRINNVQEDLNVLLKSNNNNVEALSNKDHTITDLIKTMPFNKKEEIEQLESLTEVQLNVLAQELSLIGGSSVLEVTKTLMYRSMTNKLGSSYTWEGIKSKNSFKSLKLSRAIIMAVRLNPKTAMATEMDIIKVIKAWLLRAKERYNNNQNDDESYYDDVDDPTINFAVHETSDSSTDTDRSNVEALKIAFEVDVVGDFM